MARELFDFSDFLPLVQISLGPMCSKQDLYINVEYATGEDGAIAE